MAAPNFTTFTEGSVIGRTGLHANMVNARAAVNQLDATDFDPACIQRENMPRPFVNGDRFESTFQGLWKFEFGNVESPNSGSLKDAWGPLPDRVTIPAYQVTPGVPWPTPLGRTIFLPFARTVKASVGFDYLVSHNPTTIRYPTGAATGNSVGRFVWCWIDRSTGILTVEDLSEDYVYPSNSVLTELAGQVPFPSRLYMSIFLAAGTYDWFVGFMRATTDTLRAHQIDVSRVAGIIEAV